VFRLNEARTIREVWNTVEALHITVEILDTLRPRFWKAFILSLLCIGIAILQMYNLPPVSPFFINGVITVIVSLAALFLIWTDYCFSLKTYHQFQNKIIAMTAIKLGTANCKGSAEMPGREI
jgi:hypothetical protein